MANKNLQAAKAAKKDEFYTQLTDIEKELRHYKEHFKGKVVYCNCDDPLVSNFVVYFIRNFEHLGLKRLIATCYRHKEIDLFGSATVSGAEGGSDEAVYLVYEGDKNGNHKIDPEELDVHPLKGDGDFRSAECIELLKQADIVCTNPPFSLFREYVAQLMEYEKKFLIIGNVNAITLKEFFHFMMENKIWLGQSIHSGDREFQVPTDYPLNASGCRKDEEGRKFIRVKGVRWFTNLDYEERHEPMVLWKKYNAIDNPSYDNYDAIEVSKTSDIPENYDGIMGVPITFMDKYCPDQFDIIGMAKRGAGDPSLKSKVYTKEDYPNYSDLNATPTLFNDNGILYNVYPRILIRRKPIDKL